jgi:hypothetical protein
MTATVTIDRPSVAKPVFRPRSKKLSTVSASALAQHFDCSRTYIGKLEAEGVIVLVAVSRWSVNAAFPTQQPLWLHVKRMAQLYEFVRVERRAPALPLHDLCLTVTRQCREFSAIHMGLSHRARQALADPLLLGDVLLEHRRASLGLSPAYT